METTNGAIVGPVGQIFLIIQHFFGIFSEILKGYAMPGDRLLWTLIILVLTILILFWRIRVWRDKLTKKENECKELTTDLKSCQQNYQFTSDDLLMKIDRISILEKELAQAKEKNRLFNDQDAHLNKVVETFWTKAEAGIVNLLAKQVLAPVQDKATLDDTNTGVTIVPNSFKKSPPQATFNLTAEANQLNQLQNLRDVFSEMGHELQVMPNGIIDLLRNINSKIDDYNSIANSLSQLQDLIKNHSHETFNERDNSLDSKMNDLASQIKAIVKELECKIQTEINIDNLSEKVIDRLKDTNLPADSKFIKSMLAAKVVGQSAEQIIRYLNELLKGTNQKVIAVAYTFNESLISENIDKLKNVLDEKLSKIGKVTQIVDLNAEID